MIQQIHHHQEEKKKLLPKSVVIWQQIDKANILQTCPQLEFPQ